ncbi:unnamed protein product [Hermetia illucens]|uniref:Gustatory receptor n=1 Tax=Hermetia illucens TaxID=343691 RepID=A0A7R8YZW7_HERIL|nr:unnamed protein product [Hermetia illucens]
MRGILVRSVFWGYYSVIINTGFIAFIAYALKQLFITYWTIEGKVLSIATTAGIALAHISTICSIGTQLCKQDQFLNLVNRIIVLGRNIHHDIEVKKFADRQFLALFLSKIAMWVLLKCLEFRFLILANQFRNWESILYWTLISTASHVGAAPLTLFYVSILFVLRFYNILNSELKLLVYRMKLVSESRQHNKMEHYCKLSDLLDAYISLFIDIHGVAVDAVKIFQFQNLVILSKTYVNLVARMYYIFLLAETAQIADEYLYLSGIYSFFWFIDDLLSFFVVTLIKTETNKSGKYERVASEFLGVDERLQKNIEMLSFLLILKRHDVKFCGMVDINRAFILSIIFSAIFDFMLLIQFHRATSK